MCRSLSSNNRDQAISAECLVPAAHVLPIAGLGRTLGFWTIGRQDNYNSSEWGPHLAGPPHKGAFGTDELPGRQKSVLRSVAWICPIDEVFARGPRCCC